MTNPFLYTKKYFQYSALSSKYFKKYWQINYDDKHLKQYCDLMMDVSLRIDSLNRAFFSLEAGGNYHYQCHINFLQVGPFMEIKR